MRATTTTNTGHDYEEPLFGSKQLNYFIKSLHHYAEKAAWRLQGRTSTEGLCGSCISAEELGDMAALQARTRPKFYLCRWKSHTHECQRESERKF